MRSPAERSAASCAVTSRCRKAAASRRRISSRTRARTSSSTSSTCSTRSRRETGKTVSQIALNWVLQRPSVVSIVVGARNAEQLRQNLGAAVAEADGRADGAARSRERDASCLSVLASARLRRPQSAPDLRCTARKTDAGLNGSARDSSFARRASATSVDTIVAVSRCACASSRAARQ